MPSVRLTQDMRLQVTGSSLATVVYAGRAGETVTLPDDVARLACTMGLGALVPPVEAKTKRGRSRG